MKRLFACLFVTAVLPLMASPTQDSLNNSAPFATIAYAGHSLGGSWCECGTPGCICDPGETPIGGRSTTPGSDRNDGSLKKGTAPALGYQTSGVDLGSSALVIALAIFLWTRVRA